MSRLSAAVTVEVHFSWREAPELRACGTVWRGAGTWIWIWDVHRGCGVCFPRATIGLVLSSKAILTIPLLVAFLPLPLTSLRFFLPFPVT